MIRPPPPAYETAWERGLRQAKEMRRRSHKRREMDVEYEEKKASLSLTQVTELYFILNTYRCKKKHWGVKEYQIVGSFIHPCLNLLNKHAE